MSQTKTLMVIFHIEGYDEHSRRLGRLASQFAETRQV